MIQRVSLQISMVIIKLPFYYFYTNIIIIIIIIFVVKYYPFTCVYHYKQVSIIKISHLYIYIGSKIIHIHYISHNNTFGLRILCESHNLSIIVS